ncbi:MAG: NUDIX hydrolase [Solirubrobacterales bacterium]|nr:NUDIX hydrolase [Solirubrobacterales bacterium]
MIRHCWRCAAALPGPPPTTCASCGEVHYANPKPCGDAVVVDGGRVLLLRRAREPDIGAWDVPGGFCEADEHPMHAAERELAEELGVTGHAVAYIGTWMDVYGPPAPDGTLIHTAVSGYLIALDDPDAELAPQAQEATEARWFELQRPPEHLAFARHARPLLAAAAAMVADGRDAGPLPDRTW